MWLELNNNYKGLIRLRCLLKQRGSNQILEIHWCMCRTGLFWEPVRFNGVAEGFTVVLTSGKGKAVHLKPFISLKQLKVRS